MGDCEVMHTVCVAEGLASTLSVLTVAKLALMKQPRGKHAVGPRTVKMQCCCLTRQLKGTICSLTLEAI